MVQRNCQFFFNSLQQGQGRQPNKSISICWGLFFAQSDKFNVIPSFNFSKSNFAQKKTQNVCFIGVHQGIAESKRIQTSLTKTTFDLCTQKSWSVSIDKIFYSTATCQIITILCPWVLRPMHSEIFSRFRNQDCNDGVALILCYTQSSRNAHFQNSGIPRYVKITLVELQWNSA